MVNDLLECTKHNKPTIMIEEFNVEEQTLTQSHIENETSI